MNTNPRMSTVRPTPGSGRNRREEEDNFMHLPDKEIVGCINDIGIQFNMMDLQKPNATQIQQVFEWFAEILMNATRDSVAPAMRAAAEDVGGPFSESFSSDTRDLMGFFVVLRVLLVECGVHDFTFQDLYKPTRERLVKIFSYIINFVRFRESQTPVIDEHVGRAEKTQQRIDSLYTDNQARETRLAELERSHKSTENGIREKTARSEDLQSRLRELKKSEKRVLDQLDRARQEQARLRQLLEDKVTQTEAARRETQKLRPYTTQSPAALEASLKELSANLNRDRDLVETLDRRARALQTSSDSFAAVLTDVQNCTAVLRELQRDLAAEEAILAAAAKNQDACAERTSNVKDIEREERQLAKQLRNVQDKTDKLRKRAEEKRAEESRQMEKLRREHDELRRERGDSQREMERRRVRIEQTEKKMADLKENIENEIHAAHDQYVKLDSHVRLYIKEMEQSITEQP